MKKGFCFLTLLFGLFIASTVQAQVCNMLGCSTSVTTDSGTGKNCYYSGRACNCSTFAIDYGCSSGTLRSSCLTGEMWISQGVGAQKCCGAACMINASEEAVEIKSEQSIASLFEPEVAYNYFGYVNSTNRSGNVGRTTSATARLDVCLGSTDTDTALSGGNVSSCVQYCGSTNYNDYCSNSGYNNGQANQVAAVCQDRCECSLNDSNCENL